METIFPRFLKPGKISASIAVIWSLINVFLSILYRSTDNVNNSLDIAAGALESYGVELFSVGVGDQTKAAELLVFFSDD